MTTGATGQLGLALPVQGELSGTWGDTVNNGITEYTNIAIAGTLTLTDDGAVTLANTTGDASASNITSSLTGAGTVTAQFAIVKVTGTLTAAKVITGPSYSKTYVVDNTTATYAVTFKASGQTGVSIVAGEKATVYYNGTDYVKVASSTADGVTTFSAGTTGFTPSTATSGAVTLAGTLATTNGGTGLTSFTSGTAIYASSTSALSSGTLPTTGGGTGLTSFTANGVVYASSTSALATGSSLVFDGTNLGIGTSSPAAKLQVYGGALTVGDETTYAARFSNNSNKGVIIGYDTTNNVGHIGSINPLTAWTDLVLNKNGGNLGLGVTPSAWAANYAPLQTLGGASFSGGPGSATVSTNAYYNAGWKYISTAAAAQYDQFGGHRWFVAPSGTAGDAITFTQALTLDSAGYLSGVWADKVTALGNSGTATTITCTSGNVFTSTLTGNCTFTLSAPSTTTANTATSFTLILTNDGTAGRTVAFSGGTFKYPGGSVTRTTTANATDIWFFFSPNGGTTWYVSIPMANLS